jgi:hypothetical protein
MTGLVLVGGETRRRGQARKLEREDEPGIVHQAFSRSRRCRPAVGAHVAPDANARAEGAITKLPRLRVRPEGVKRRRGYGRHAGLNLPLALRISARIETSRSTHQELASPGNRGQASGANGEEGRATDEVVRPGRGRNPLERESWTWQQDETSLQGSARSKPSRA